MKAKYNVVERRNPRSPGLPGKYYPSIMHNDRITLRELAIEISDRSTVNRMDILAVLDGLLQLIPKKLGEGRIIDLDFLGSFYLRIGTKGEEKPSLVNRQNIESVTIRFLPSVELREQLQLIHFERASEPEEPLFLGKEKGGDEQ